MRTRLAGLLIVAGSLVAGTALAERKPETPSGPAPRADAKANLEKPAEKSEKSDSPNRTKAGDSKTSDSKASDSKTSDSKADENELDPKRGRGTRSLEPSPSATKAEPEASSRAPKRESPAREPSPHESKSKSARADNNASTKRPQLPRGSARPEPDRVQRRSIAGGPTFDDLRAGKDDRELRALREAELVLFPQPLPGLVPGWSWDLSPAVDPDVPDLIAGAPAAVRLVTPPPPASAAAEWVRQLVLPNLPVRLEERVLRYLSFYRDTPSGRAIARAWAKKSGRFGPALKSELGKAGLPTDLVWLSLVESAHNPTITSPAGAAGLWQFMPDAGRAYGLAIDRWVDERLDPQRSTEAACRHLSDLYRRFGAWDLAMASYNMGHSGLLRAIRKYNSNDFWELSRYEAGLPWETTLYVPKILATAIVMANRRAFGLDDVEPEAAERFETVLVAGGVLLEDVARLAAVPASTIESLNPQYLAGRTPPSNGGSVQWPVRVPPGMVGRVREALSREALSDETFSSYVVRAGDTVESIAQARGATEAQIRTLNRVDPKETLAPGTILLVPRSERTREDEPADNLAITPPRTFDYPDRQRVFYRVLAGDTLSKIAPLFGVRVDELGQWNALDVGARLQPGLCLQVFAPKTQSLAQVRYLRPAQAKILVAGSPEFFDYFEAQNGRRRFVVRARNNDSLAEIGKRYGSTVASMERINRRSRNDPVSAGEPVVVYTERTRPAPGDELYAASRVALPLQHEESVSESDVGGPVVDD